VYTSKYYKTHEIFKIGAVTSESPHGYHPY
jgi:hypothetical protein